MKLKDAARLGMLIETEGCIQVHRPYVRKGENCLSSPHIGIDLVNTDMGILSWTKTILEKDHIKDQGEWPIHRHRQCS